MAKYEGGVWNMVFVGVNNAPPSQCGKIGTPLYTNV